MKDENIEVGDPDSGAYIELFTRDGVPVARMTFFDKDTPIPLEKLVFYKNAIERAIAAMRPLPAPQVDDLSRCAVCGWPLAATWREGCVRGNCSLRPRPDRLYSPNRAQQESGL